MFLRRRWSLFLLVITEIYRIGGEESTTVFESTVNTFFLQKSRLESAKIAGQCLRYYKGVFSITGVTNF